MIQYGYGRSMQAGDPDVVESTLQAQAAAQAEADARNRGLMLVAAVVGGWLWWKYKRRRTVQSTGVRP